MWIVWRQYYKWYFNGYFMVKLKWRLPGDLICCVLSMKTPDNLQTHPVLNYVHSWWGTSPLPVRMCIPVSHIPIPGEAHRHSWWGTSPFLMRHIAIPDEDVLSRWGTSPFLVRYILIVIHPHREWGCALPGMHILTGNGDVPHRECTS